MDVSPTNSGSSSLWSAARQQDRRVQDVFSAVLATVGRQGYASASPLENDVPLGDSIKSAWSDWFHSEIPGRYATESAADRQRLEQGYEAILARAYSEGGYAHPQDFLRGLSRDELKVVQNVQHLAAPIQIDPLSEEGALNLLLPPAAQVDLNNDGVTQTGVGSGLRFPSSNTPPDVVAAWEQATAGLSPGDRMMYELQMVLPVLLANIHADEHGAFSYRVEPGDPRFVNPMADPAYSYVEAAQAQLDHLKFALSQGTLSPAEYERRTGFWSSFQQALAADGENLADEANQ